MQCSKSGQVAGRTNWGEELGSIFTKLGKAEKNPRTGPYAISENKVEEWRPGIEPEEMILLYTYGVEMALRALVEDNKPEYRDNKRNVLAAEISVLADMALNLGDDAIAVFMLKQLIDRDKGQKAGLDDAEVGVGYSPLHGMVLDPVAEPAFGNAFARCAADMLGIIQLDSLDMTKPPASLVIELVNRFSTEEHGYRGSFREGFGSNMLRLLDMMQKTGMNAQVRKFDAILREDRGDDFTKAGTFVDNANRRRTSRYLQIVWRALDVDTLDTTTSE